MPKDTAALASLIGSRICHDLISPIGAINNGLELISLSGGAGRQGPEMELIQQSCDNATAKIEFFRIAYGSCGASQVIAAAQAGKTLERNAEGTRMQPQWHADQDLPRYEVQLAFLAYQCLETMMPMGGTVTIGHEDGRWRLRAVANRISDHAALWTHLSEATPPDDLKPAHVQFALLAVLSRELNRPVEIHEDGTRIDLAI